VHRARAPWALSGREGEIAPGVPPSFGLSPLEAPGEPLTPGPQTLAFYASPVP